MTLSGTLARPLLAGVFIYGGIDALRDPEGKAKAADDVAPLIAETLGLPTTDTVTLVRINGGIQVVAGSLLAMGKWRRLSALALAASLVPTTYAGHRFWEEADDDRRAQHRVQFLKNAAMLGGLVLAAADTGGRPTVGWQARRAAKHAVEATLAAGAATQGAAKHLLPSTGDVKGTAAGLAQHVSHAADAARQSDLVHLDELTRRARKAAKKAQKAQLTRRAIKAARRAEKLELTKRARKLAKKARKKADKLAKNAKLAQRASATASRARKAGAETVARAKEALPDDAMERLLERAQKAAERAKEALPVAS